jgi:hypothetical protein
MIQDLILRISLVATLAASSLFAARPFTADDARTVTSSGFEVELGTEVWQDDAVFGLNFKHGLTNRMDTGVNLYYTALPESAGGFGNAEVVFKFGIIPDLFAASFTGILSDLDYVLNGIVTHIVGPFEIDMNLGYETSGMEGIEGTFMYALAIIYDIRKFTVGAEISGDQEDVQSWLAGVRCTLYPGFALDGGIAGSFLEERDLTATVGIHYEF